MTNYEMTEKLSEKMGVTMEKAKEALEACGWDMLDASILLEQEAGESAKEFSTRDEIKTEAKCEKNTVPVLRKLFSFIGKLIRIGNRNRFEIWRRDEMLLDMPVTVAVLLALMGNGFTVALLIIGLFTGFKYRFSGEELGKESINSAIDRAANAVHRDDSEVKKPE